MISQDFLTNLPSEVLLQQKQRFSKRNAEIRKMNQYLASENREIAEKNEDLRRLAERLIKISNGVVLPEEKSAISRQFHKIFSPLKEKIKADSVMISDLVDHNKRALMKNLKKTKETFHNLKENFSEMLKARQSPSNLPDPNAEKTHKNGDSSTKKKIFDNFPKKAFEISPNFQPQDITSKNTGVSYIEEIKFDASGLENSKNPEEKQENGAISAENQGKNEAEGENPQEIESNEI